MTPADLVGVYLAERESLIATSRPGGSAARALSELTDSAVSSMGEIALSDLRAPWVVLALGGWGARRLLPGSDLDLLVVTDAPATELRPALERVLYPLWDSGLQVGHQVRSRRDHSRAARSDIATLTATLTGRVLCGDPDLGLRLLVDTFADAGRRSRRLLEILRSRDRTGSPYLLEPDLKEGAGGQRDLDELTWTAAILSGTPAGDPSPLVALGVLSPGEAAVLAVASERITAARWALHLASPRPTSLLSLDVAEELGQDVSAVQAALADVHHILLQTRERALRSSTRKSTREEGAADLLAPHGSAPVTPAELFRLLDEGERSLPELERAAWSDRLDDLWPGLRDLMTIRRPGLAHAYTVGAHSLRCAAFIPGLPAIDAGARQRLERIGDVRALQAAALLHDAGKVQSGPGHPARGAAIARTLLPRFGLGEEGSRDAVLLIREHLLLPEVAGTQDVHDEDVLLRAADRIGQPHLVDCLYLLTAADSVATGPGGWTPWHAALLGELADRLSAALAEDVEGAGVAARAEEVRTHALALLGRDSAPEAASFVRGAHLRYLATQTPGDVAAHAALAADVARTRGGPRLRISVTAGPVHGTWRLTVAAADRPGLFVAIAGALALAGLDILSADAYAAPGDVVLDTFVVRPDTLAAADTGTWSAFERYLTAALDDHLELEARLSERRRHYAPRSSAETTVSTEAAAAYATVLYVTAADRVGLLHDIARAISESGLDIRWARATTRGGVVRDVFHIVDAQGEPVDDPGVLGHLSMRIRERA